MSGINPYQMAELLSSGTKLGRYEIRSKIGEGGMGEVYLAEDTQLHRKVALKILTAEFAAHSDRMRRFKQEAMAAAALNHPNIAHIYEVGDDQAVHFIAMEFVDGITLRQLIHEPKAELSKLLRHLQHVAEGLAKAHAAGIVHRDLKPDNMMVTRDGHAKILDFGLAKLLEPAKLSGSGSSELATAIMPQHSTPGAVMGTVGYMSPEQAQGKTNEIDQRSDIFSFGCILFETATGRKPFEGDSIVKSLHMMIYEPAPLISDFNPSAPAELQRIVRRCLAKDPDERYQSIKEVAIELKALRRELADNIGDATVPPAGTRATKASESSSIAGVPSQAGAPSSSLSTGASGAVDVVTGIKKHKLAAALGVLVLIAGAVGLGFFWRARIGSATGAINSIAVMPFVNASGNADVEYLSDGLTDSLIFRFSQLPNVRVSPTSSVMRFKGTTRDVAEIAKELDVDAVLSGRVMKAGDDLSISIQLIDARTQKLIWAEQYDRKMADLLATQREIATTLTQKMQLRLAADERGITKKYTSSNDAYQLYLKGRYHWSRRTKNDLDKAIDSYQRAIQLDPKFALAYAAMAEAYNSLGKNPDLPPKDCIPLAKAAATQALEIDPLLPQAHSALADSLAIYDWDWAESERHFKKALELDPNISYTHLVYSASYLYAVGQVGPALAEAEKAVELEPLSLINNSVAVSAYLNARQYDKALTQARTAFDLDPTFPLARHWLGFALVLNGKYDEAISISRQVSPDSPSGWLSAVVLGHAYAKQGKRAETEQQISLLRDLAKTRYVRPYYLASIYAALGDKDKAFAELEKAFAERDCYLGRISVDPLMDALRDDPRFKSLTKRMNLSA